MQAVQTAGEGMRVKRNYTVHIGDESRRRRLTFTCAPGRSGQLTWSQRAMLEPAIVLKQGLNIHFAWPLRSDVSEEEVLACVLDLITTHEALRTVYVPPPEGPAQRALDVGELVVDVVDAGPNPDASLADAASTSLASAPFEIAADLPIRVALLTSGGRPWNLAFALSHLVTDLGGIRWIQHHLRALLAHPPAEEAASPVVRQPLDEQAWECSAAGRRAAARALLRHEATLRMMPQTMLPRIPSDVGSPRFRYVQLDSPALAIAVPALAARHEVLSTAVLYAGICSVVGFVSGLDRGFFQVILSNRPGRMTQPAVGMLSQSPPSWVSLKDASLGDVISRAGMGLMSAMRFGRYPPEELMDLRRQVEVERGVALDLSCWLNDRRKATRTLPVWGNKRPTSRILAQAAKQSQIRWGGSEEASICTYQINVDDAGEAMRLTMLVDTAVVPPDEAAAWLTAVERLLCAAVSKDVGSSEIGEHVDLARAPRAEHEYLIDGSYVHLPSTTDLVSRVAGLRRAEVFPVQTHGGMQLVAFLDCHSALLDIGRLHRECLAALPSLRTAMAPHLYVLCGGAPLTADITAWRRIPVLAEGTGRPPWSDRESSDRQVVERGLTEPPRV